MTTTITEGLATLIRKLKHEPGVLGIYLVGSALSKTTPRDLDIVLNLKGPSHELRKKYQDLPIIYKGKKLLVDLHIHSTNVPEEEWLPKLYGSYKIL